MKIRTILLIAFLVAIGLAFAPSAEAQTATYNTTTTTTLNATQTCFVVTSVTNMSASGALTGPGGSPQEWDLWTDGEFMKINTVNTTSKQVCVQRGKSPTRAGIHATTLPLWFGPAGSTPFILSSPLTTSPGVLSMDGQFGSCVSTQYQFLPLVNVANGSIWNCEGSRWLSIGFRQWTTFHPRVTVSNAAYTVLVTDEIVAYTSISAARVLTLPTATGLAGKTLIVKDESGSATSTGSVTITITGSGSAKIDNGNTAVINSAFGVSRLYTDGSNWFTW